MKPSVPYERLASELHEIRQEMTLRMAVNAVFSCPDTAKEAEKLVHRIVDSEIAELKVVDNR